MSIWKWILSLFSANKKQAFASARKYPYRSAGEVMVDAIDLSVKSAFLVRKPINYQPWLTAIKEVFPMRFLKIASLVAASLLSLVSIGAVYDVSSPNTVGIRTCAGIALGVLAVFFAITLVGVYDQEEKDRKAAERKADQEAYNKRHGL